jgi:hypothetical protein
MSIYGVSVRPIDQPLSQLILHSLMHSRTPAPDCRKCNDPHRTLNHTATNRPYGEWYPLMSKQALFEVSLQVINVTGLVMTSVDLTVERWKHCWFMGFSRDEILRIQKKVENV